jgi:hypothetical protein
VVLASCHFSGTCNFEVAPALVGNLWTPCSTVCSVCLKICYSWDIERLAYNSGVASLTGCGLSDTFGRALFVIYLPHIYDGQPVGLKPLPVATILVTECWQVSLN